MEDPKPPSGRTRKRQERELAIERSYEVGRVESSVQAAAYEAVLPPTTLLQRGSVLREYRMDSALARYIARGMPVTACKRAV